MKKSVKSNLKVILATSLVWVLLLSGIGVLASTTQTRVEGLRGGISVRIDGTVLELTEEFQPVMIDDRTFIPVRPIGDALGLDVDWDPATRTVILDTPGIGTPQQDQPITPHPDDRPLLEVFPRPDGSVRTPANRDGGQNAVISGRMFPNSFITGNHHNFDITFPLNGEFTRFTAHVGARDGVERGPDLFGDVRIFGDGVLLGEFRFNYEDDAIPVSLDVTDVQSLVIMTRSNVSANVGLAIVVGSPQIR